jgi:hypothetical protein
LEDPRNVGENSCNPGDGTDQRVQSLMFMMIKMKKLKYFIVNFKTVFKLLFKTTFYISKLNYFEFICNISFKEHLTEDDHDRWPKHVAGYAVCDTVNLLIGICTCWMYISS